MYELVASQHLAQIGFNNFPASLL